MKHWLVKTEPETYSWDQLVADKKTHWDGVRNYAARNNLRAMEKGDSVLVYHSGDERQVVGIATVVKTAYQDPTTDEDAWVAVDLKAYKALKVPVTLKDIKAEKRLADIALVRLGRLSVVELTKAEYETILQMGS